MINETVESLILFYHYFYKLYIIANIYILTRWYA